MRDAQLKLQKEIVKLNAKGDVVSSAHRHGKERKWQVCSGSGLLPRKQDIREKLMNFEWPRAVNRGDRAILLLCICNGTTSQANYCLG